MIQGDVNTLTGEAFHNHDQHHHFQKVHLRCDCGAIIGRSSFGATVFHENKASDWQTFSVAVG